MKRPVINIGIDPGVHTGVCIQDSESGLYAPKTLDFWDTVDLLKRYSHMQPACTVTVYMEDPNAVKGLYKRHKESVEEGRKLNKIAQNVGGNKRDAQLLALYCELVGLPLVKLPPLKGRNSGKWTEEAMKQYTGYSGSTSQHARDAARLIAGRIVMKRK